MGNIGERNKIKTDTVVRRLQQGGINRENCWRSVQGPGVPRLVRFNCCHTLLSDFDGGGWPDLTSFGTLVGRYDVR